MGEADLVPSDARPAAAAVSAQAAGKGRCRSLAVMALVLLPAALFWPTTRSLMAQWQDMVDRTYTHGYLIVALSLWLLWRGASRWAEAPVRAVPAAFIALVVGGLAWLVAYRAGLQVVHQALLPALIVAAVVTCCGWRLTGLMALPLGYLYFAVPIWDALIPLLQSVSVVAVRFLLRVVGIPAFFTGNTFQIPAGMFEIADGCSGLHFFVVALAIAVLYGELSHDRWRVRIGLVALAGLLAMLANWLRIFIIVVAGHLTQMQHYLVSGEHYTFGWLMFAATMMVFFFIARRLPAGDEPSRGAGDTEAAVPPLGFALAIAGLLVAPLWNLLDANRATDHQVSRVLPQQVAGWRDASRTGSDWQPIFKGADHLDSRTFSSAAGDVEVAAAIYREQRQGKEVVGYGNSVLGAQLRAASSVAPAATPGWREVSATDMRGAGWLVQYSYRIGGHWHDRPLQAQLAYGVGSLLAAPVAAIVMTRAPCAADCNEARTRLDDFARTITTHADLP